MPVPERQLIRAIRRMAARSRGKGVVKGIGDDCAVLRLPAGHEALVTTDFSLEGVHFRREWHPPQSVGHRCLARGLSDIAAMGGEPLAAFLSLALPPDLPQEWVEHFLRGMMALARKFKVELAGGDTATAPPFAPASGANGGAAILADIVVVGSAPRGKTVLRSGARAGDDIFVTGTLGGAAAVLHALQTRFPSPVSRSPLQTQGPSTRAKSTRSLGMTELRQSRGPSTRAKSARSLGMTVLEGIGAAAERAHFYPVPRVEVGQWLRERGLASAMIDLSDGLSTDLAHICEESGVGAWIAEKALPVATGATLDEALNGGEDYELLFTAAAAKHDRIPDRIAGVPVRWIGTITKRKGVWLVAPDMKSRRELAPRGWEHFRNS